jgi:probable HAF family extracellular repeat protein
MKRSSSLLPLTVALALTACQDVTTPEQPVLPPPAFSLVTEITTTDLGTLGGPGSLAEAVNDLGQVVGTSRTAGNASHAFLWQNGTMIDLGTLGGPGSVATAVNDRGHVVGWSDVAGNASHAFLWQNGTMIDLGTLGGSISTAVAVDAIDQVVGSSYTGDTRPGCVAGCPLYHAFSWQNGTMIDLGTLGGSTSEAVAVNALGQVVGRSPIVAGDPSFYHAFLWQNGTMIDLGTLGGIGSEALAVNDLGQVVGRSDVAGNASHAFLWQNGTMIDLGTLGGSSSRAVAVNALGQVVGNSLTTGTPESHAFLWQNGTMIDLGTLGGTSSEARAVNDLGQVVGWSQVAGDAATHAFLWQNGTMIDLGTLGGYSSGAHAVNALGQVVGGATDASGQGRATVWTVTQRPATPTEEVSILTNAVNDLVAAGLLTVPQSKPLLNILANAQKQIDKGHFAAAADVLEFDFIPKVQADVAQGILSAADGQTLIDAAQNAIHQLRAT